MKTFFLSFFLLAGTYTVSFAQTNSEYSIALKKMVDVSGAAAGQKVAMNQMINSFKSMKNLPADFWTGFEKKLNDTFLVELFNMMVPIYQKHFSLDEVKQLTAFYETPVGRKMAEKTPIIMTEIMQTGSEWGRKIGEELSAEIQRKGL